MQNIFEKQGKSQYLCLDNRPQSHYRDIVLFMFSVDFEM